MSATPSKTKPKNFASFLKKTLSAESYDALTQTTGISRHRLTKIEKNPSIATELETRQLAMVTGKKAIWLLSQYEVGFDGITYRQGKQLEKEAA